MHPSADKTPVNKQTAMLLTTKGEQHASLKVPDQQYCDPSPPPDLLSVADRKRLLATYNLEEMTGETWGRMTCVGALVRKSGCDDQRHSPIPVGKLRWVCRCNCGNYMLLTGGAVRRQSLVQCLTCNASKIDAGQTQPAKRPLAEYETPMLLAELARRGAVPSQLKNTAQLASWIGNIAEMLNHPKCKP